VISRAFALSLMLQGNSLLRPRKFPVREADTASGIFELVPLFQTGNGGDWRQIRGGGRDFPCIFPVIRVFRAETGLVVTATTTIQFPCLAAWKCGRRKRRTSRHYSEGRVVGESEAAA
jgi:hypothetical protein